MDTSLSKEKLSGKEYIKSCIRKDYSIQIQDGDFSYGPEGKPYIGKFAHSFNLSHSDDLMCLIICGYRAEVGIDIQVVRRNYHTEDIARRAFLPDEIEWMEKREDGFFQMWTMKEALIKAHGGSIWDSARYGSAAEKEGSYDRYLLSFKGKRYYLAIYPGQGNLILPDGWDLIELR